MLVHFHADEPPLLGGELAPAAVQRPELQVPVGARSTRVGAAGVRSERLDGSPNAACGRVYDGVNKLDE
jgi:hypothetical protein